MRCFAKTLPQNPLLFIGLHRFQILLLYRFSSCRHSHCTSFHHSWIKTYLVILVSFSLCWACTSTLHSNFPIQLNVMAWKNFIQRAFSNILHSWKLFRIIKVGCRVLLCCSPFSCVRIMQSTPYTLLLFLACSSCKSFHVCPPC